MENRGDTLFWIWLSLKLGACNKDFLHLLEYFGSPFDIMSADESHFRGIDDVDEKTLAKLCDKNLRDAGMIMDYCSSKGYGIICYNSENYPKSLRALANPPIVLYYKGKLPDFNNKLCVSMVGTRKMSEYGMRTAYKIGYELASAGTVIVSGMALGIDSVSQCGAVAAGGKTVAVIGCGLDVVYPPEHEQFEDIICQNGAVITEYPPSTPPVKCNFPQRNRIISGLSQGTLVVEADLRSGSLITARDAIIQGRDVFAVPGMIEDENSSGTNMLIHDGAVMVLKSDDIFDNYKYIYSSVLDGEAFIRSKDRSDIRPDTLKKYGVSSRCTDFDYHRNVPKFSYGRAKNAKTGDMSEKEVKELRERIVRSEDKRRASGKYREEIAAAEELNNMTGNETDNSANESLIASLDEDYRKVLTAIPFGDSISVDEISKCGVAVGNIMAALTMLEIMGLVRALPGGFYTRNK